MKKRYASLDLVKFLGVLCISCLYHYRRIGGKEGFSFLFEGTPIVDALSRHGALLVELLFMISGLLAFQSYFGRISRGEQPFSKFLSARVSRLFPVMIASTLVMAAGQWIFFSKTGAFFYNMPNNDLPHLLFNLFGVQMWISPQFTVNQPTWYISVLLACYLIFFGISSLCKKRDCRPLFIAPILLGLVILSTGLNFAGLNSYMARGLISFFLGVTLAMLLQKAWKSRTFLLAALGILAFCCLFYLVLPFELIGDLLLFLPFFIYPALITLCMKSELLNKVCDCGLVRYLGAISFDFYLWDIPIYMGLSLVSRAFHWTLQYDSLFFFLFVLAIHFVVAIASHHLIEKPMVRIFEKKREEKA